MRRTSLVFAFVLVGLVLGPGSIQAQSAPGPPTGTAVVATAVTLQVTWSAPAELGGSAVTAYHVRHIESAADATNDDNWTVAMDAWGTGGGDLAYTIEGLLDSTSYKVGVRAVNAQGPSSWTDALTISTPDHGHSTGQATPLPVGGSLRGQIDTGDEGDLFKFTLPTAGLYWVFTTGELDTKGRLGDAYNDLRETQTDGKTPRDMRQFSLIHDYQARTYHIRIRAEVEGATGTYTVHLRSVAEPGDTKLAAQEVTLGQATGAILRVPGEVDYFRFTLTETTDVAIESAGWVHTRAQLLEEDETEIAAAQGGYIARPSHGDNYFQGFMMRRTLSAGSYLLKVSSVPEDVFGFLDPVSPTGAYFLLIEEPADPGSSRATATPLALRHTVAGRISSASDEDYYSLTVDKETYVTITAVPYGTSFPLVPTFFDADGTDLNAYVIRRQDYGYEGRREAFAIVTQLAPGTYYVRVKAPDGGTGGPYVLSAWDTDYGQDPVKRCTDITNLQSDPLYGDPLYGCQWHLKNTRQLGIGASEDINVEGVWETNKGEGINVAVVDTMVQPNHEDLVGTPDDPLDLDDDKLGRFDTARSHDYYDRGLETFEPHGTNVAGLIAARANDIGVRGVAPEATIYSFNLLAQHATDAQRADAFTRHMDVTAISNHSYGAVNGGIPSTVPGVWRMALERAVTEGYDGKGLFITWAAGNDGDYGGWASLDERTTSYAVTPVCAIDIYDKRPVWSNRGPNLWVCAPGHDLTSTITANRYTRRFAGTSGATPIVAGVAALVRAADPDLTWRDVKLILANSARKNDPAHGRLPGALKYGSTSERYSFSYDYGFGAVDAGAAVALAKNWTELPTLRKLEVSSDRLDMAIPDAILGPNNTNMVGMEISANLTPNNNYIEFIEFIELEVSITHRKARNLFIRLDSPSTTTSQITVPYWGGGGRSFLDILTGTNWPALQADMVNPFTFGTARHLGESVDGEWTLRIRDDDPDARGTLHSWKLTFYGHGYTPGFPTLRAFDSGERIAIRWDPPEDTGATPITSYDLRYIRANAPDKSDELLWTVVTGFPDPNRTNNYVRGLLPGRKYDLQLRAVSATGAGPWSAVSRAGPHPERPRAPAIGEIVPRDRGLGVTWSAPAENGGTFITRYDLRVRSNPTGENNPGNWREFNVWSRGDLTARISGLTNNVSHDVQVRARNRIGVGPWSTEVVTGTPAVQNQPPSFPPAETGTRAILEDPLVERNVGAPVSAVDPDTGDSLTYFLSSGDEFFRIDSKTGQLLTRKALDRETVPSHVLIVDVSDSKDSSDDPDAVVDDTIVVTVTVEDVNEAPKVMGETSVARDENSSQPVGRYSKADPEGGATTWLSLMGADEEFFTIDEFGELSFAEPPDFEARADSGGDNVYNVIVRASDDGTPPLIGSLAVTVTVTPVNEPPAITGDRAPSIEEEGATAVGTYGATDPESATIAWLPLDGADKDKFDFTPSNGRLAFKAAPDFEDADRGGDNEYSLTLGVSAGGDTTPFDVEVTVTNKEEPGTLELSTTQPQADAGYTATLGDPDGVQSTTWTWERSTSGSDPWSAVSGAFDRTTTSVYTPDTDDVGYFLRVTAAYTDGHGPNKSRVRVSANTVKAAPVTNDPPSFDEPTPTRSIAENAGANARVGDPVTATDPDAGDVITYELSGSDLFTIDSNSGLIRVKTRESLDYDDPAKRTQTVTVKASDSSNASATVQVTIEVTDVNEPPDADADAPRSFDEDTAITIDVLANDSDPEQEQSELLLRVFNSGPNAPRNGTVTVNEPANAGENRTITYEPKLNYHGADTFTYQVRDTGSPPLSSTASVSIEVDAVNDAPVFPPSETGARSVPESAKAGANVGSAVTATDVDNAMLTYRLSGADASSFDIDSDGQITVGMGVTFDAAMKDEYAVTVTADDGRGEAAMVAVTITVTAGPVRPVIIITGGGGGGGGPSGPTPSEVDFEWNVTRDIEQLDSGHDAPTGAWSDGSVLWLAENGDGADDAVYAYDLATGERVEEREFELDERNRAPRGVWSNELTAWVADSGQDRLFAYDLESGDRDEEREIVLHPDNDDPRAIWSDGSTMWVLDDRAGALFAYDLASGELLAEYALHDDNDTPHGLWSDGVTVWVSNHDPKLLFAYRLPAPEGPTAEDAEPQDLERVRDEEFGKLSRASNNSPRGIWSDGDVMYVADASDGKVYSYNLPDAIDARLASLALSGIEFGEFDPGVPEYEGVPGDGVTETTVEAAAAQDGATVVIEPEDADGDDANGHQVALQDLGEITVTVTSQDGSRKKTYRVQFPETAWDPARDPWPHCLRGAVSEGFSLVVYEGGSIEDLAACAESRDVTALYALHEDVYVSNILGAPDFVNAAFVELFPDGLPPITPLVAGSNGPPSADPFGDLDDGGRQPWPGCLRGAVAAGFSLVVYEGGSVDELEACARSADITALYALSEGEFVSYILGAPAFVTQPFRDLFAEGLPLMAPLVVKSEGLP